MRGSIALVGVVLFVALAAWPAPAAAQSLGTFRWQTQPYCNVLTLTVTQTGSVYTLDGFDDQCRAVTRAPLSGTAVQNPDGTIQFALDIVASPQGKSAHISVPIDVATLGGPWKDDAGHAGTFTFTPGSGTGGSPRPVAIGIGAAAVDATQVQLRVKALCASGGVIQRVHQDGAVTCVPGIATTASGAADLSHTSGLVVGGTGAASPIPASGPGRRLMWYPGKAAFRVGEATGMEWDDASVGLWSTAAGHNVTASGVASVAAGANAYALGSSAIALGFNVAATGTGSVALGSDARSDTGAFTFADRSVSAVLSSGANQFNARASGGVGFYTNTNLTAGVELKPGASAWSSVSDVNRKDNFRDLDGDDVLRKIARMPIREWNYKAQDAAIRHVGPTAQDFHAAFGLGEDELRISTIDADGIALRAIQALEARLRAQAIELAELRAQLERLEAKRP